MEKAEIKKNSWVAWSEDEVKLLKKLFPRGRARKIAEQTGRPLSVRKFLFIKLEQGLLCLCPCFTIVIVKRLQVETEGKV